MEISSVYAQLGVALYQAQAVEYALVNLYTENSPSQKNIWSERLKTLLSERRSNYIQKFLEDVLLDLELPADFMPRLHGVLLLRRWLLHHFYHELAKAVYDTDSALAACERLQQVSAEMGSLVFELNAVLVERQLRNKLARADQVRVDRSVQHYLERIEMC